MHTQGRISYFLIVAVLGAFCISVGQAFDDLGQKPYLNLSLDYSHTIFESDGQAKIPATVTNCYSGAIELESTGGVIGLRTLDSSGDMVQIDEFKAGRILPRVWGGPINPPFVLMPSESVSVYAISNLDDLKYISGINQQIFGILGAVVSGTHQHFFSCSQPFLFPSNLIPSVSQKLQWVDLGQTNKFSLSACVNQAYLVGGTLSGLEVSDTGYSDKIKSGYAEELDIPIKVTNVTSQQCISVKAVPTYTLVKSGSSPIRPNPSSAFHESCCDNLGAGESDYATCSFNLNDLSQAGYQREDLVMVAVEGRIPNTNQIFVSYSAPFVLPILPNSPPKSEFDIMNETGFIPSVPLAPTGLNAVGGDQQITLSWSASGGVSSYCIYRSETPGGESGDPIDVVDSTTYVDIRLTNGITYYYKVKAQNLGGLSNFSPEISALAGISAPPTGLIATAGESSVSLKWDAAPGASGYSVFRGTTPGGEDLQNPVASALENPAFTDSGLANGHAYYYVVTATNQYGSSNSSQEASATPLAAPDAPSHLTATAGNFQVKLAWYGTYGATSYEIYRGLTAGGEQGTPIATSTTPQFTDTAVQNGTAYFYKVRGANHGVFGPFSSEVTATPFAPSPTQVTALGRYHQVILSWAASAGAIRYDIYRADGPTVGNGSLIASTTTGSFTDTGLTNWYPIYLYRIKSIYAGGVASDFSTPLDASAKVDPPKINKWPKIVRDSVWTNFTLDWNDMSVSVNLLPSFTTYDVFFSSDGGSTFTLLTDQTWDDRYVPPVPVTGMPPQYTGKVPNSLGRWWYRVRAHVPFWNPYPVRDSGVTDFSDVVYIGPP